MKKSKKKICLLIFVILFVFVFLFTACKIKDGEKDNNGDNSSGDIVESGDINSGDNPVHKHEFSTEWSCDDKYHWHACKECGEADEKQEHDFDSRNKCKQCGYLKYTEGLTLILIKDVNGGLYYSVRNVGSAADSLIVIPSEINGYPVKEIESNAFKNCTYIEDFIIPESITNIEEDAFTNTAFYRNPDNWIDGMLYIDDILVEAESDISGEIDIKEGTRLIAQYAFESNKSITKLDLPASLEYVNRGAFMSCDSLQDVNFSGTLDQWCNIEFYDMLANPIYESKQLSIQGKLITELRIPVSIKKFNLNVFTECESITKVIYECSIAEWCAIEFLNNMSNPVNCSGNLYIDGQLVTNLVIPSEVEKIGDNAFRGCDSLTKVVVQEGVKELGEWAFNSCASLSSISLPSTLESVGMYAFANCTSLTTANIPEKIEVIPTQLFYKCSALSDLTVNSKIIKTVAYAAFYQCKNITEIALPGIEEIKEQAFKECTNLQKLTLGKNAKSIGYDAFRLCSNLKTLYFEGDINDWLKINVKDWGPTYTTGNPLAYGGKLYFQNKLVENVVIPEGVTELRDYLFTNCASIKSIELPNSLMSIGTEALSGTSITELTLPDKVTEVGEQALVCPQLVTIRIGKGVKSFGSNAFSSCYSLKNVYYNGSITDWCNIDFGRGANGTGPFAYPSMDEERKFYINNQLVTELVIPGSVKTIKESAFVGMSCIKSITLEEGVEHIAEHAFSKCLGLTSLKLPNTLKTIGYAAFDNTSLTSLVIPDSVQAIASWAFWGCNDFVSLTIGSRVEYIGESAFKDVTFTSVTFKNTSNWYVAKQLSDTTGTNLTSSSLSNKSTSASYLKGTYREYYWRKTDSKYEYKENSTTGLVDIIPKA